MFREDTCDGRDSPSNPPNPAGRRTSVSGRESNPLQLPLTLNRRSSLSNRRESPPNPPVSPNWRQSTPNRRASPPKTPNPTNRRPSSTTNYEFINSQDSGTRSLIQRHTANHAAQQRRQQQIHILRECTIPHNFEWQRRPGFDPLSQAGSPMSSANSLSPSPVNVPAIKETGNDPVEEVTRNPLSRSSLGEITPNTFALALGLTGQDSGISSRDYSSFEESMLQYFISTRCPRSSHAQFYQRLVAGARSDEASAYLIIAYATAYRATTPLSPASTEDQAISMSYKVKAISVINTRLSDPQQRSSDTNIYAVLFLLALENIFGTATDAQIHLGGLRKMIYERGGLGAFRNNFCLELQLWWTEMTGTALMVLECAPDRSDVSRDIPGKAKESCYTGSMFGLNQSLTEIDQGAHRTLRRTFTEMLQAFQSNTHLAKMRTIFPSGSSFHRFFTSTIPVSISCAHSGVGSFLNALSQCKLACLLYISVFAHTSMSLERSSKFFQRVLECYRQDYPTGESVCGLLWTLIYCLNVEGLNYSSTAQLVLNMMTIARLLDEPALQVLEQVLMLWLTDDAGAESSLQGVLVEPISSFLD